MPKDRIVQQWVATASHVPGATQVAALGVWFVAHCPKLWGRIPAIFADERAHPTSLDPAPVAPVVLARTREWGGRVECWSVASPAMGRVVHVQISRPTDSTTPAPLLFLFDGVSAPRQSGWLRNGHLLETMGNEHVTIVMPTEASGSMYLDWVNDDPVLGRCRWDTFLLKELLPLLRESGGALNPVTEIYTAGLSMGAGAAVRLASQHPEVFSGTIGISGWYHATSRWGRIMCLAAIRCMGGDPASFFGPGIGSIRESQRVNFATLRSADVAPEGLRTMPVFLASFNGKVSGTDLHQHTDKPVWELLGAALLEILSLKETKLVARRLRRMGATATTVRLCGVGVHGWSYASELLLAGWEFVRARPKSAEPPGSEDPNGVRSPSSTPTPPPSR